jgi:adenosylhomocysteine nucleosidase
MNFIVALSCEAKPIIDELRLTKQFSPSPFPVFRNDFHRLVVSGIGKVAAAAATGFLLGSSSTKQEVQAYLNVGIAGHGTLQTNTAFIASCISDDQDKAIFYPPQIIDSDFEHSRLCTCSNPNQKYEKGLGFDMEAHAFYSIASRSATRELIQVLKVVSDNEGRSLESIQPTMVKEYICNHLLSILTFAQELDTLAKEISPNLETLDLQERARKIHPFSQSQIFQLDRLISHSRTFDLEEKNLIELIEKSNSPKEAIHNLNTFIDPARILS